MLIQKGYGTGDVVCFKMVNGDEIVAKIVEQKDKGWEISKPCTVIPGPQGIGLLQSLISAEVNTNVVLNSEHIIMHAPVVKHIENHYIQVTTGIEIGKGLVK